MQKDSIFQDHIPQVQVRQCQLPPLPDVLLAGGHVGGTPRRRLQGVQHVEDPWKAVWTASLDEMRAPGGRNGSYEAIAEVSGSTGASSEPGKYCSRIAASRTQWVQPQRAWKQVQNLVVKIRRRSNSGLQACLSCHIRIRPLDLFSDYDGFSSSSWTRTPVIL